LSFCALRFKDDAPSLSPSVHYPLEFVSFNQLRLLPHATSKAMTSLASSSSSLFTGGQSSCSTAGSSYANTLPPPQASQPLRLPSLKASLIHLPLHLPPPPEPFAEVEERLILDDDLQVAPQGFVVHKLRSLGEFRKFRIIRCE